MGTIRRFLLAAGAALLLVSCGGGDDDGPRYAKLVVFGDSLSDVGSYRTPGVAALGGGKYTVNGPDSRIWVELIGSVAGVAAPCAAQTGLESSGQFAGLAAPITNVPNCFGYAQGGARVTQPVGPYNKALLAVGDQGGALGQITDPVVNQMNRHLAASGGTYAAGDLVLVLAGGNDVFMNLAQFNASVGAGGDAQAAAAAAVTAMGVAGAELAGYVQNLVVARGATRVVVVNLPDVSTTPFARPLPQEAQALIEQMSATFNQQLSAGLAGAGDGVLLVDWFADSQALDANPAAYGISNALQSACDPAKTLLRSLTCTASTLIAGDTSRYYFADDVHPGPYGYSLLASLVARSMSARGWL
jgi:phospholipase/lecithinase/hemolysin